MSSYGLEVIGQDECRALLRTQRIGRIGICSGRAGVFPVLYTLLGDDIVLRTAPGEKLIAAAMRREVVFEIDAFDVDARSGWSVIATGTAEEIVHPDELTRANALGLEPWAGEVRDRYVRICASELSGRRIRATES